jgi:hypothetical protein
MRPIVVPLAIILFAVQARCQHLQVNDLLRYFKMEVSTVTKELSRKNFKLIRKSSDNIEDLRSLTYFYTFKFNSATNDAVEWFALSTYDGEKSRLMYETELRDNYISFVESLSKAGFHFKENIEHEGQNGISSYYENAEYTVIIQPRSDRWTIYFRKTKA